MPSSVQMFYFDILTLSIDLFSQLESFQGKAFDVFNVTLVFFLPKLYF
jgi:hypothetical protein